MHLARRAVEGQVVVAGRPGIQDGRVLVDMLAQILDGLRRVARDVEEHVLARAFQRAQIVPARVRAPREEVVHRQRRRLVSLLGVKPPAGACMRDRRRGRRGPCRGGLGNIDLDANLARPPPHALQGGPKMHVAGEGNLQGPSLDREGVREVEPDEPDPPIPVAQRLLQGGEEPLEGAERGHDGERPLGLRREPDCERGRDAKARARHPHGRPQAVVGRGLGNSEHLAVGGHDVDAVQRRVAQPRRARAGTAVEQVAGDAYRRASPHRVLEAGRDARLQISVRQARAEPGEAVTPL
mmetsp:Transcript_28478/g.85940  ORF Transcript_28478/g.85940 Transcript_28478/m.85940 type:complete len:296 (+) Transcript_28478:272-1159(+)